MDLGRTWVGLSLDIGRPNAGQRSDLGRTYICPTKVGRRSNIGQTYLGLNWYLFSMLFTNTNITDSSPVGSIFFSRPKLGTLLVFGAIKGASQQ